MPADEAQIEVSLHGEDGYAAGLRLNGVEVPGADVFLIGPGIAFVDPRVSEAIPLLRLHPSHALKHFGRITLHLEFEDHPFRFDLILDRANVLDNGEILFQLSFEPLPETWALPWSASDFWKALAGFAPEGLLEPKENGFRYGGFVGSSRGETIGGLLTRYEPGLRSAVRSARESVLAGLDPQAVVMFFNFPDALRAPAAQYLSYFGQFLLDLGTEAELSLSISGGEILFSATPADKTVALDRVRHALDGYLRLPSELPAVLERDPAQDRAVDQLLDTVDHLRRQLRAADATIRAQDAHLRYLDMGRNQRVAVVGPGALPEDDGPLGTGVFSLVPFEKGPFKFDLARLLRQLRRRFR